MNSISLIKQEGGLRSYFPNSEIIRKGESELVWIGVLIPTPLSEQYHVKLHYRRGSFPRFYVLTKLALAQGETILPHVYSTPEQRLCLFYPKAREWHPGMWFVKSIIPWASEWLFHYEIWAGGGGWQGGGVDHDIPQNDDFNLLVF